MFDEVEFVPRYNGYHCTQCGEKYLTVDLAPGVTPMFMTCFATENCLGQAVSMGYPKGTPPLGVKLMIEFFKPTQEKIEEIGIKNPALIEHFNKGGLMRRAVDTAPQWVKDLV